jgi:hypothetical protein
MINWAPAAADKIFPRSIRSALLTFCNWIWRLSFKRGQDLRDEQDSVEEKRGRRRMFFPPGRIVVAGILPAVEPGILPGGPTARQKNLVACEKVA